MIKPGIVVSEFGYEPRQTPVTPTLTKEEFALLPRGLQLRITHRLLGEAALALKDEFEGLLSTPENRTAMAVRLTRLLPEGFLPPEVGVEVVTLPYEPWTFRIEVSDMCIRSEASVVSLELRNALALLAEQASKGHAWLCGAPKKAAEQLTDTCTCGAAWPAQELARHLKLREIPRWVDLKKWDER